MGADVLTTADVMMCPHGGTVTLASSQSKVSAGGATVLRPGDTFTVAGCAFSTPGGPHPCVVVEWQNPSQRASVVSQKVLTTASIGLCKAADQAPQGTVLIQKTQMQVSAQ
jgi:hypothetical protein